MLSITRAEKIEEKNEVNNDKSRQEDKIAIGK